MKHQRKWDRCLYCDASIAGDDALDAGLHDPYCPHGKAISRIAELEHKMRILTAERDEYSRLYFALKTAPERPEDWPDDFDPRTDGDGLGVHNRD